LNVDNFIYKLKFFENDFSKRLYLVVECDMSVNKNES